MLMDNKTLFQFFEWYLPEDGQHWKRLETEAGKLARLGITGVWTPPAYKGQAGKSDVGYGVYDLYDLGEFDQKGTVPTKYGTRDEYLRAVRACHDAGLEVYADIVLNHRMGADEAETVRADAVNSANRNQDISPNEEIQAWTKFTFPGRHGKYSDFVWNWSCFDGVDWDDRRKRHQIFEFEGKTWENGVDTENGNYDYLMGADLDMKNPAVLEELDRWGRWYLETVGMDGFRLDAVKHIDVSFFPRWLGKLRSESGRQLPAVGEYWHTDVNVLRAYLEKCGRVMRLFDVPLHFKFRVLSGANGTFDLRELFRNTLTGCEPEASVTFVDNHDTQPGQALESWVAGWCKPMAYACILLRQEGLPCVFYGDLYGIPHDGIAPVEGMERLLLARKKYAYGPQHDYLDSPEVIGWTREGDREHPGSGMAVVLTDRGEARKRMYVGTVFAGELFLDYLGNRKEAVTIGADGFGEFPVNGGSVSVWIPAGD